MECVYLINKLEGNPAAYVGSTINTKKRFSAYKSGIKNTYVERSISKHGWDNFQKLLIEVDAKDEKELRMWEGFYIGLFGTYKEDEPDFGMNLVRYPTLAISKDPVVAKKISVTKTGRAMSEECKQKISNTTKGKLHVGTKRPYLSERNKVVKPTLGRTGDKHPMSKKLLYTPNNILFDSIKDAADYFGVTRQAMRSRIFYKPNLYKLTKNGH
jgi:group I intron endonuclease